MQCPIEVLKDEQEILEEILSLKEIKSVLTEGLELKPKVEALKELVMSYFKDEEELCKFVNLHIEAIDENSEEFIIFPESKREYERIKGKLNSSVIKLIEEYFIPYCNFIDVLEVKDISIFSPEIKRITEKEIRKIDKCLEKLNKKLEEVRKNGS